MIGNIKGSLGSYSCSRLYNVSLTDIQIKILTDIAINGPVDAYREHKRASIGLSSTQNVIKKLSEYGLLKIKEIDSGDTNRIRKIYQLTGLGFCVSVIYILNTHWSSKSYDDFHKFLQANRELFPYLLDRWDDLILNTREAYKKHSIQSRFDVNIPYFISFPDGATNDWCVRLYRLCESEIQYCQGDLTPEVLRKSMSSRMLEDAKGGFDPPHQPIIDILKQDPVYLSELKEYLLEELEDHKEQVKTISEVLKTLQ